MPHLPQCPTGLTATPQPHPLCNFHSHLQQLSASALRTDRVIAKITTSTASCCCCCCCCIPIECMRIAMIFALSSSLTSLCLISSHLARIPRSGTPIAPHVDSNWFLLCGFASACVCASFASLTLQCLIWFGPVWFLESSHASCSSLPASTHACTSVLHSCGRDLATGRKRHTKAYYKCRIHLVIYQQTTTTITGQQATGFAAAVVKTHLKFRNCCLG